MNQSAILAAALLAGFGLFIASRDRLPVYARILWGDKPGTHSSASGEVEGEQEEDRLFPEFSPFGQIERALPDLEIPDFNWDLGQ